MNFWGRFLFTKQLHLFKNQRHFFRMEGQTDRQNYKDI